MLTVVRVGGSLARGEARPGLADLCREIAELGASHPLVLIPGGGAFADTVREHDRRFRLSDTAAHWMAVLAMDQYGWLLRDLVPGATIRRSLDAALLDAAGAGVPILLPSTLLHAADPLPHGWQVTSDSIAAWIAGAARASRVVLLKDVDGLAVDGHLPGEVAPRLTVDELEQLQRDGRVGGVDEHLPRVLRGLDLETWVINGACAHRLTLLLTRGTAPGTRIDPG